MPFKKNDQHTRDAARQGGLTGHKHFVNVSGEELSRISRKAGIASGRVRRARKGKDGPPKVRKEV